MQMQKSMKRFVPLSKVEDQPDGTLKVWGYASSEAMDADGDVIKADAMKAAMPEYMKYGNIREMHTNIAAGVAFEWDVLDDGKTFIGAHIVDEGSVKKVKKGVLKGFSIGGNGTECDPDNPKIITALELNEISLVDRPANPDAVITLWKAKKMSDTNAAPSALTNEQAVEELAKELNGGTAPQLVLDLLKRYKEAGANANTTGATTSTLPEQPTSGASKAGQQGTEMDKAKSSTAKPGSKMYHEDMGHEGAHGECKACADAKAADDMEKSSKADDDGEAMEKFTKAKDSDKPYGEVEYADPGYQEDGKKRYPIDTEEHIRAAWSYINKEKNAAKYSSAEVSKIKAKIVAAWKKHIDPEGPPSAKEKSMEPGTLAKSADGTDLNKGTAVNTENGTAAQYPKVGDAVVFKDGEFTHQAKINEINDGVATVNSENFEVSVKTSALGQDDSEANVGTPTWVTTMDQANGWKFAQSNKEHLDQTQKAAGGKNSLIKRELKKGMYDIVDMAYILMSVNSLCGYMKVEQTEEDDASKAYNALKAWLEAGKAVLTAIVSEELGEMGTAEDMDVMAVLMEKAADSTMLQKGLNLFLEKAGPDAIASMHEYCAVKLQKAAPINKLQKALASGDDKEIVKALGSQVEQLTAQLAAANASITKLQATPLAGGAVGNLAKSFSAPTKVNDLAGGDADVAPVIGSDNKVDPVATEFKKALAGGGQNLFKLGK